MLETEAPMGGKRVLFWGVAALLATAGCVAVLAGFFYVRARWDPFPRSALRFEGDWPFERDDEIGFVAVRNGRTLRRDPASGLTHTLFTDHRGARVRDPGDRTPARVDLLTIGCSFAQGVVNADTFTERLRRQRGLAVANFAMGSYGTVHSLLVLRRHLDLRPRVIAYAMIEDHLHRNVRPCAPSYAPYCTPVAHVALAPDGTPTLRPPRWELFSPQLNRRFYEEITMSDGFSYRDVIWRARLDLLGVRESRRIAAADDAATRAASFRWLMEGMADAARRAGARLLVVYIPSLRRGETAPPPPEVAAAVFAQGDATLVDLAPAVLAHHREPGAASLVLGDDPHPSPAAHALIADAIGRVIDRGRLFD
jgi:hypothetical protein